MRITLYAGYAGSIKTGVKKGASNGYITSSRCGYVRYSKNDRTTKASICESTFCNFDIGKNSPIKVTIKGGDITHNCIRLSQGRTRRLTALAFHSVNVPIEDMYNLLSDLSRSQQGDINKKDILGVLIPDKARTMTSDIKVRCFDGPYISTEKSVDALVLVVGNRGTAISNSFVNSLIEDALLCGLPIFFLLLDKVSSTSAATAYTMVEKFRTGLGKNSIAYDPTAYDSKPSDILDVIVDYDGSIKLNIGMYND
jgi:hypothetical protein